MRIARSGFTLVELMVSSLLFSLVIAALSAIYSTAFGQSGKAFREGRVKAMALGSMKAIMKHVGESNRIDLPTRTGGGITGRHLTGCSNQAPDGARITPSENVTRFHFCVRLTNLPPGRACDGEPDPAPCMFYYTKENASACVASDVTDANCGTATSAMGSPRFLASGLEINAGMPANGYFTRAPGALLAGEANSVRMTYKVTRAPVGNGKKTIYIVDTTASGQFGVFP